MSIQQAEGWHSRGNSMGIRRQVRTGVVVSVLGTFLIGAWPLGTSAFGFGGLLEIWEKNSRRFACPGSPESAECQEPPKLPVSVSCPDEYPIATAGGDCLPKAPELVSCPDGYNSSETQPPASAQQAEEVAGVPAEPPLVDYEGSEALRRALGWSGRNVPARSIGNQSGVMELTKYERDLIRLWGTDQITQFYGAEGIVGYYIVDRRGNAYGGSVVSREGDLLWEIATPLAEASQQRPGFAFLPVPIPLGSAGRLLGWAGRGVLAGETLLGRSRALVCTLVARIRGLYTQAGWRHINPASLSSIERELVDRVTNAPRVLAGRGINIEGQPYFTLDNFIVLRDVAWTQRLQDVYNYALYLRTRAGSPVHIMAGRKYTAGEAAAAEAGAAMSGITNIPFWP